MIMIMIMIMMIMEIISIMRINVENEDDDNYDDNLRFVVREPHSTPISWRWKDNQSNILIAGIPQMQKLFWYWNQFRKQAGGGTPFSI